MRACRRFFEDFKPSEEVYIPDLAADSPGYFTGSLSLAYLTVVNFVRLEISAHCLVLVLAKSQYFVRLLFLRWITAGHTIQPPIKCILPQLVLNPHRSGICSP